MWRVVRILLFVSSLLGLHTCAEQVDTTGNTLYKTPGDSDNGSFIFPRTYPLVFDTSSKINVSWHTPFDLVDIYYIQSSDATTYITAYGIRNEWYEFDPVRSQITAPEKIVLWITDAGTGTDGFWSTSLYFADSPGDTPALTGSVTALASKSLSTLAVSTRTSSRSSERSSSISSEQTTSTWPTLSTLPPSDDADYPDQGEGTTALKSNAIVGLTIGVITGFIALVGFIVFLSYQRRQRKAAEKSQIATSSSNTTEHVPESHEYTPVPREVDVRPVEMEASRTAAEVPAERKPPHANDLDELVS